MVAQTFDRLFSEPYGHALNVISRMSASSISRPLFYSSSEPRSCDSETGPQSIVTGLCKPSAFDFITIPHTEMYVTSVQNLLLFFLPLSTLFGLASQVSDEQKLLDLPYSRNCTTSLISENDQIHREIVMLPYETVTNTEAPKIPRLNASAWDFYFFDAISSSPSAITLSFFRKSIHQKVQLLAVWPSGENFVIEFLAKESELEECAVTGVKGSWRGEHGGSATFEITQI